MSLVWDKNVGRKGTSTYPVSPHQQRANRGVYQVDTSAASGVYQVDTSVYLVDTSGGISPHQERDEEGRKTISKTSNNTKKDCGADAPAPSPVSEKKNDELNGHRAGEATHSGLQQRPSCTRTTSSEVPDQIEAKKPSRKPSVKKKPDASLQARIDAVYAEFDKLRQEAMNDPSERYARTKKATDAIKDFLECNATSEKLRMVYLDMWNAPTGANGFNWQENMTIPAVCRNYDTRLQAIQARQRPAKPPEKRIPTRQRVPLAPEVQEALERSRRIEAKPPEAKSLTTRKPIDEVKRDFEEIFS